MRPAALPWHVRAAAGGKVAWCGVALSGEAVALPVESYLFRDAAMCSACLGELRRAFPGADTARVRVGTDSTTA